jgi:hypothetical protein
VAEGGYLWIQQFPVRIPDRDPKPAGAPALPGENFRICQCSLHGNWKAVKVLRSFSGHQALLYYQLQTNSFRLPLKRHAHDKSTDVMHRISFPLWFHNKYHSRKYSLSTTYAPLPPVTDLAFVRFPFWFQKYGKRRSTVIRQQRFFIPFPPSDKETIIQGFLKSWSPVQTVPRPAFRFRIKRNRKVVGMKKQFINQN